MQLLINFSIEQLQLSIYLNKHKTYYNYGYKEVIWSNIGILDPEKLQSSSLLDNNLDPNKIFYI